MAVAPAPVPKHTVPSGLLQVARTYVLQVAFLGCCRKLLPFGSESDTCTADDREIQAAGDIRIDPASLALTVPDRCSAWSRGLQGVSALRILQLFDITGRVGEGTYGVVYLARAHSNRSKLLAIKTFKAGKVSHNGMSIKSKKEHPLSSSCCCCCSTSPNLRIVASVHRLTQHIPSGFVACVSVED